MSIAIRSSSLYFSRARHCLLKYSGRIIADNRRECGSQYIKRADQKILSIVESQMCYMSFPKPESHKTEKCLMPVINKEKPPVVILFGWGGCIDKHLKKYSKIYEDRGYTIDHKLVLWERSALKAIGRRFIELLHKANIDSNPIIVHSFSNGGLYPYQSFATALAESSTPIRVKGVIFDSAPGERGFLRQYKSISSLIRGNSWYNLPASVVGTIVWRLDEFRYSLFGDIADIDPSLWLKGQDDQQPQLLIYSKSDAVIHFKDIEAFINVRKSRGVDVSTLRFEDSPHVKHYSYYPKEYIQAICTFLSKCLKTNV